MSAAPGTPATALEVEGVDFAYPRRPVLEGVSFQVPAGAFCVEEWEEWGRTKVSL